MRLVWSQYRRSWNFHAKKNADSREYTLPLERPKGQTKGPVIKMNLKYIAIIAFLRLCFIFQFLSMKLFCEIKRARQKYGESDLIHILNNKLDFWYKKELNFTLLLRLITATLSKIKINIWIIFSETDYCKTLLQFCLSRREREKLVSVWATHKIMCEWIWGLEVLLLSESTNFYGSVQKIHLHTQCVL